MFTLLKHLQLIYEPTIKL